MLCAQNARPQGLLLKAQERTIKKCNTRPSWAGMYELLERPLCRSRPMDSKVEELIIASRQLLAAYIDDYGNPSEWPDDESVADGLDFHSEVKFGQLRRLQDALKRFERIGPK